MKLSNKIIIVLSILLFLFIGYSVYLHRENKGLEFKNIQNTEALKGMDTLRLSNDQLLAERSLFVSTKQDLEKQNSELTEQVKILERKKNKVKIIVKTEIRYLSPKIEMANDVVKLNDTTYQLTFSNKTDTTHISGYSQFNIHTNNAAYRIIPGITVIDTNSFKIDLIYGIREKDGVQRVFATSTNPNISFNDIEGYILRPSEKEAKQRFNLGIQAGVGYLPLQNSFGPYIGAGIQYNIRLKN